MKILINDNQLKGIIKEGSIRLTANERNQVEKLIPKIIKIIQSNNFEDNEQIKAGIVFGNLASGEHLQTTIYVGVNPSPKVKNVNGYFQRRDPLNLKDNLIFIQQKQFAKYFKGILKYGYEFEKEILGNENMGVEVLRKTLVHELIHSKDPILNQYTSPNEESKNNKKDYFGSKIEFATMTGQFFEAIISSVDRSNSFGKTEFQIIDALDNILMVYSGKKRIFNQNAKDFIQGSKDRNLFQNIINKPINFFNISIDNHSIMHGTAINTYDYYLKMVKRYNPKQYNKFLRELYRTINETKDKTNLLYKE